MYELDCLRRGFEIWNTIPVSETTQRAWPSLKSVSSIGSVRQPVPGIEPFQASVDFKHIWSSESAAFCNVRRRYVAGFWTKSMLRESRLRNTCTLTIKNIYQTVQNRGITVKVNTPLYSISGFVCHKHNQCNLYFPTTLSSKLGIEPLLSHKVSDCTAVMGRRCRSSLLLRVVSQRFPERPHKQIGCLAFISRSVSGKSPLHADC